MRSLEEQVVDSTTHSHRYVVLHKGCGGNDLILATNINCQSSTSVNPFAPPPGFGVGSQSSTVKSFANVTSSSLPKEDEPESECEDEEEALEGMVTKV